MRITFRLSEAGRVVFVVHGPAPSCEVVGRFSVRGKRGTNRIPFKGRVGRKTLEPGTYRITAKPAGRPQQRQRVVVIVGEGPRERLQCSSAAAGGVAGSDYFGGGSLFGEPAPAAPGGSEGGETSAPAAPAGKERERDRGVLPAVREKVSALPKAIPMPPLPGAADSPPMIVGLAALALLALSAIAILAYVIRFLRGPGTKSA